MNIPWTTIGTFVGANIIRSIATSSAEMGSLHGGVAPKRAATAGAGTAVATALAATALGYYMGGTKRPNTAARGLLWTGGLGLAFGVPSLVGAVVAETSSPGPERQPAKVGGPLDTDLVQSAYQSFLALKAGR